MFNAKVTAYCAILLLAGAATVRAADNDEKDGNKAASPVAKVTQIIPHKGYHFDAPSGKYFTDGKSNFAIKAVENGSYLERIDVSVDDGAYQAYTGKLLLEKEGLHTVRFRAVDPVMNWSPVQVFSIYVDLTAPITKWNWKGSTHQNNAETYVHPSAKLVLSAEDSLSGVQGIWLAEGDAKYRETVGELSFSKAGPYLLTVFALDRVGNHEAPKELKFTVDDKAPTSEATVMGEQHKVGDKVYIHYSGQIVLNGNDGESGLKKVEYQINNGPAATYTQPIPVSEKTFVLRFRAVDGVENAEPWKTVTLYQDSTPPKLAIKELGNHVNIGGKIFAQKGFKLQMSVSDQESGVKSVLVSRNGAEYASFNDKEFSFDSAGEHRLNVRAVDYVGNTAESSPITVVIDDTAPKTDFQFSEKTVSREDVILAALPNRLEFRSVDEGSGLSRIEYSFDGKLFTALKDPIDLSTWKETERVVSYRGVDRLGNVEEAKQVKVRLLVRAPVVDLFVESENLPNVPLSRIMGDTKEAAEPQVTTQAPAPAPAPATKPARAPASKRR